MGQGMYTVSGVFSIVLTAMTQLGICVDIAIASPPFCSACVSMTKSHVRRWRYFERFTEHTHATSGLHTQQHKAVPHKPTSTPPGYQLYGLLVSVVSDRNRLIRLHREPVRLSGAYGAYAIICVLKKTVRSSLLFKIDPQNFAHPRIPVR